VIGPKHDEQTNRHRVRSSNVADVTVRIVTDSACDLSDELLAALDIEMVPLSIRFGDEEFTDRVSISSNEFWRRCAASRVLPQTAAPAPGAFGAAYEQLIADGASAIVAICLSGQMSATYESAVLAAQSVSAVPIEVIDSRSITMGLGMIVVDAARSAKAGATFGEVTALVHSLVGRTYVIAVLDTLENLKKGGRIGGAKALLASVLSIKPVIKVIDGVVAEGGRQRTRTKALTYLVDQVKAAGPLDHLAVMHAACDDVDTLVERLRPIHSGEIVVGEIGAVIGTHGGPGTIGVVLQPALP
jgi:DegV family protein with EDD domain